VNGPNPDLLRAEFLGVTVRHEEVRHDREATALLFAGAGERYELTRMEWSPEGGATMSGSNGAELVLRPAQTASATVTGLGFHEGLERVTGLLDEALAGHAHERLWIDDITLVAIWDCEEEDAARRHLSDEVLGLDRERADLLGGEDDDAAHGLRVWRRLGEGSLDIAVEPMHADTSKIYVRLVYSEDDAVPDTAAVAERAEAVNAYLHGPLAAFVRARARR
jgi:hypothetical protein